MTINEFQNVEFGSTADMLDAIAYEFWTSNGESSPEQIDAMGCSSDGMAEAKECIEGWGLDRKPDSYSECQSSHMELNNYSAQDLAHCMRRFWDERPDKS